ncbi:hypothetical protein, partial [[Clostridium] innocuum]|uniref:hypothetical protein n=1 Tax=Clostridium innocuum TaxID=1522 RepID=UPI001EDDAD27
AQYLSIASPIAPIIDCSSLTEKPDPVTVLSNLFITARYRYILGKPICVFILFISSLCQNKNIPLSEALEN